MLYKSPQTRLHVSCLLTTISPLLSSPSIRTGGLPELPPLLDTDGGQVPSARILLMRSLPSPIDAIAFGGSSSTRRHSTIALHRRSPLPLTDDARRADIEFQKFRSRHKIHDENKSVAATRANDEEPTRTNGRMKSPTRTNDEALGPAEAIPHQLGAYGVTGRHFRGLFRWVLWP
ncbi:uncharacterized protein LACBIDRAFT_325183 [Laccaria bicolor S238N-H82]|uniref:Predicted protein n=1 Tax=Laccaria bicolor (strain S238N-H82 / ATCC MYA-4686) TaxID=486041 RepID=B0D441_LACBS|nr:uncharacterized protein LACBIDRAFT_325183 [Laccaria bicolor S238N-H82]EDR10265.1 predicted protein [Laccaria bicolor S238N-H82]|eukprot:XP_001878715.1 predicted protein [Laccaria bicolor S238N-H82]